MQIPKLFKRCRNEQGSSLLEATLSISLLSLILIGTTFATTSATSAATTHMLRSSATTQANLVISYVGGVSPEPSFRAVSNCPDEQNHAVPGLPVVPPSATACVKVWGTVAHKRLPDYRSSSYDAATDAPTLVPTTWVVEITDPLVANGTRVTFTSSSSVTYEEGVHAPRLSSP